MARFHVLVQAVSPCEQDEIRKSKLAKWILAHQKNIQKETVRMIKEGFVKAGETSEKLEKARLWDELIKKIRDAREML